MKTKLKEIYLQIYLLISGIAVATITILSVLEQMNRL